METGYLFTVDALSNGHDIWIERMDDEVSIHINDAEECVDLEELVP